MKSVKESFPGFQGWPPNKIRWQHASSCVLFFWCHPSCFLWGRTVVYSLFMDGNHSMTWGWWKLRLRSPSRQKLLLADSCAVPQRRRTPRHLDEWNRICLGILLQIDCHFFFAQVHRTLMLSAIGVCQHTSFHHFNPHHLDRPTPEELTWNPKRLLCN